VPGGTDPTDTAGYVRGFAIRATTEHGFEEARGFNNFKVTVFKLPVGDFDDDVPMPFYPGYVMYIDSFAH
jgi:hypothetical protein